LLRGQLVYGLEDADPGVIHQDVETSKALSAAPDHLAAVLVSAHVCGDSVQALAPAVPAELVECGLQGGSIAATYKHLGIFRQQSLGDAAPNATRAARYYRNFVFEFGCHCQVLQCMSVSYAGPKSEHAAPNRLR